MKLVNVLAVAVVFGVIGVGVGYAANTYFAPHPLTAMLVTYPVTCTDPRNITTCTRTGDNAETVAPHQLIELALLFNQPIDTQSISLLTHMADGSQSTVPVAPLSHVTTLPLLDIKACSMGSTQQRADDNFDILYNGRQIGQGTVVVQSPDNSPSNAC